MPSGKLVSGVLKFDWYEKQERIQGRSSFLGFDWILLRSERESRSVAILVVVVASVFMWGVAVKLFVYVRCLLCFVSSYVGCVRLTSDL